MRAALGMLARQGLVLERSYFALRRVTKIGGWFMRVLFTGGGGPATDALWRILAVDHDVHFADANAESIHPIVPAGHRHQIRLASDPLFAEGVVALLTHLGIDLLIPGVDEELLQLIEHREALKPSLLLAPDYGFARMMLDKFECASWLAEHGLSHPTTFLLNEVPRDHPGPWIVKPRTGRGSRDVFSVDAWPQLLGLRQYLADRVDDFICQERLNGQEFTVQVISGFGLQPPTVVAVHVLNKRGVTVDAVMKQDTEVLTEWARIHSAHRPIGIYNVQGMRTEDRGFVPFEINPRASTTFCLALAAGFNLNQLTDPSYSGTLEFSQGLQLKRHWTNNMRSLSEG